MQTLLGDLLGDEDRHEVLSSVHDFAHLVAGPWDRLAREGSRNENLPRIVKHDRVANAIEQVDFGPHTRQLRREVAQYSVLSRTRSELHKFALIYYLGHLGEGSVTCGMSCTDGAIRAIEARGSQFLRDTYLPKLLSIETPLAGAQFITSRTAGRTSAPSKPPPVEIRMAPGRSPARSGSAPIPMNTS